MAIKKVLDKYGTKIVRYIMNKGVKFMGNFFKRIWKVIWTSAKTRAIEIVQAQRPILVDLIKRNADPDELANKIINLICGLIKKA